MKEKQKIGVISLGCSKNRVDSEVMMGYLTRAGYEITNDPKAADILIVNTCGFIESAKQESINTILEMAAYKTAGVCQKLVVTGCLSERYRKELPSELPEVDLWLGVREYEKLPALLKGRGGAAPAYPWGQRVLSTPAHYAYLRIADGCDNRCAYCAIPLIRGAYASRPMESILAECERLAKEGVKEVTLIAQDTSRYGTDFAPGTRLLPALLRQVAGMGFEWVRVLYCYPDTVDDALLDTLAHTPHVVPYLDLPLQHINARLLRAMNRRGSPEYIRALVEKCHALGITLRTTMIVGFPGETEEEFEELLDFVDEAQFDRLGAFTFSPEEGTAAAEMDGQIDEDIKAERLDDLMMLQQSIAMEKSEARLGTQPLVLCEGKKGKSYYGRSQMEAPESDGKIWFTSERPIAPGEFVRVKITRAEPYDLYGEAIQ